MWGFPVDFPLNQSIDSLDQTTNFRKKNRKNVGKRWIGWVGKSEIRKPWDFPMKIMELSGFTF